MIATINKNSHPKEWAIIKMALPNYRKRTASLCQYNKISLDGRYWDGGSRTDWHIIHPNKVVAKVGHRNDFPFTAPEMEVDLTDGTMAISSGIFCGRKSTASLYMKKRNQT